MKTEYTIRYAIHFFFALFIFAIFSFIPVLPFVFCVAYIVIIRAKLNKEYQEEMEREREKELEKDEQRGRNAYH